MAESTESQSIKKLTKIIQEENADRKKELEKTANQEVASQKTLKALEKISKGNGEAAKKASEKLEREMAKIQEAAAAENQIKNDEDSLREQKKLTGLSAKRLKKSTDLNGAIGKQKEIMEAQKAELEKAGVNASDNKKFQKEEKKLAKMELAQAQASGSKDAEAEAKKKLSDMRSNTFLGRIANGIGGILKGTKEKIKGGLSGFKKFAFGALAIAALSFLNSPKFEEIKKTILDVVIPALAYLYDNVIKPLAEYIGGKLKNLFEDLKSYVDGEKGIGTVILDNIGIIAGIVTALAPGLVFGALKIAALALVKAIGLVTTVGLLPIIAIVAGISLVVYSLYQAFDDFMLELEATGSVWEAVKTGILEVISNLFGFPLNLVKDGVSYILTKIGETFGLESFINASKAMDDFDFVEGIRDGLTYIADAFTGLIDKIKAIAQSLIRKIPVFGDKLADKVFGTEAEQAAAKKEAEEEQKRFEEKRKLLREQKKLEDEAEEAKKIEVAKKREATKIAEAKKKQEALVLKVDQSKASNRQKMIARKAETATAAAAPSIFNAPTTVSAPSTTNVSSTTTTLSNNDRVIDSLSFVT